MWKSSKQSHGVTGCITCKIRKVICDEKILRVNDARRRGENAAAMCKLEAERSTGRRASRTLGYAFLWNMRELRAFDFFRERTGPTISDP